MSNALIEASKKRRSQYTLGKKLPLSTAEVTTLIEEAIRLSPSPFNSQSSRAVILFGAESDQFWNMVKDALRKIVPADAFSKTEDKINNCFAAGAGTVLFYEDQNTVADLQKQFPAYADNFPIWSEQSSGIAQFSVWTALADAGIGASLQHYNPLPDAAAAQKWHIPASWKLRSQMPFGSNEAEFPEKTFIDDHLRFKVFGA